jgi:ribonuclease P protein component
MVNPPAAQDRSCGYPSAARLRKNREFQAVYRRGKRASDALMTLVVLRERPGGPRFGVSASRRIGKAVERNRAKRLLRETFRLARPTLPGDVEIVAVPRRPCAESTQAQVAASFQRLLEKALKKQT